MTPDSAYWNRNIMNRPTVTKVYAGSSSSGTLLSTSTITYDSYTYIPTLDNVSNMTMHDSAYSSSFYFRANPTSVSSNGITQYTCYDIGGNVTKSYDQQDHLMASASYYNGGQVNSVSAGGNTSTANYNTDLTL